MGYIVCNKCGGYYELQKGESAKDFEPICNCGGRLYYTDFLDEFLNEQRRSKVAEKFKQRMEEEKVQESPHNKSNQHYSNKEFIIILIIGFFLILLFTWRILVNIIYFSEFPVSILLFIILIIIGFFIFLISLGTKKY